MKRDLFNSINVYESSTQGYACNWYWGFVDELEKEGGWEWRLKNVITTNINVLSVTREDISS